jgi:Uma2 family endonuclease
MGTVAEPKMVLGPESAGMLMTPEEFDAIEDYDENYRYELIHGVLVVSPLPLPQETGPNELLGHYLLAYQESHPQGSSLDLTLPQQYVKVRGGRRIADRLIWAGLGSVPDIREDTATIAAELVSAGRRSQKRDYKEKRREYQQAGLKEYWIIDRFQRTMTVFQFRNKKSVVKKIIREHETYESPLLPGFQVPLGKLLEAADRLARRKRK